MPEKVLLPFIFKKSLILPFKWVSVWWSTLWEAPCNELKCFGCVCLKGCYWFYSLRPMGQSWTMEYSALQNVPSIIWVISIPFYSSICVWPRLSLAKIRGKMESIWSDYLDKLAWVQPLLLNRIMLFWTDSPIWSGHRVVFTAEVGMCFCKYSVCIASLLG